jgi:hypothetical protein
MTGCVVALQRSMPHECKAGLVLAEDPWCQCSPFLLFPQVILSPIMAAGIWQIRLASFLPAPVAAYLPVQLGLNDVLLLGFAACAVFQISGPMVRVLTTKLPDQLALAERGAKQIGRGAAAWQATQLAAFLVLGYMCMWEPIRREDSVLDVRLVYAAFGIAYALEVGSVPGHEAFGWIGGGSSRTVDGNPAHSAQIVLRGVTGVCGSCSENRREISAD